MRWSRFVTMLSVSLLLAACDGDGGGPIDPPDGPPDLTQSQSIQGTFDFDQITIPAGVTITATGALVLNSTGPVRIDGTLTGDCVAITVNGSSTLTVTGRVSNGCATPPTDADAPALVLIGNGDVDFDGAEVSTSGDLTVKNDPALTDADFPAVAAAPAGGLVPAQVRVFDIRNSSEFDAPGPARSGEDGDDDENGGNGRRGGRWSFFARGDLTVDDSSIDGQDGGDGGDHTRTGSGNTTAEGGNGADGGDVRLLATGRAVLQNGTSVKSGDGGDGGSATATSTNGDGARAGSATAEGGDGAEAGLLRVEGQGGITIGAAVTIEIGASGDGGDGTANGADGSICVEGHGQHGGNATATGGQGSDSPEGRLRIIGNVVGQPTVIGADAGDGGAATANAGNGHAGQNCDDCKDGGDGGDMSAIAGDGGDALIQNAQGAPVGQAGDGGAARISKGNGADGFSCCDPPEEGGAGGDGGDGTAEDGEPGAGGAQPGQPGGVTVEGAGNGADGGDGLPPGDGGNGGDEAIESHGTRTDLGENFTDGEDGDPCAGGAPPQTSSIQGSYLVVADLTASVGDCDFSAHAEFPVDMVVSGQTITVREFFSPDRSGTYDPATGQWTATATSEPDDNGERVRETWDGQWFESNGTIVFVGTVRIEILDAQNNVRCSVLYDVRAERQGAAFVQVVGFIDPTGIPNTDGAVDPGTHTLPIKNDDTGQQIGEVPIETGGEAGNHFVGMSPTRLGFQNPGSWILHWDELVLNGTSLKPGHLAICLVNQSGLNGDGLTVRKAFDSQIQEIELFEDDFEGGCPALPIDQDVERVELLLPPGATADLQLFTIGSNYGGGY